MKEKWSNINILFILCFWLFLLHIIINSYFLAEAHFYVLQFNDNVCVILVVLFWSHFLGRWLSALQKFDSSYVCDNDGWRFNDINIMCIVNDEKYWNHIIFVCRATNDIFNDDVRFSHSYTKSLVTAKTSRKKNERKRFFVNY